MSMCVPKTHRYEKFNLKKCLYPECDQYFRGTGFSKYCDEHRKRQYRKVIDKLNKKIVVTENPNQYYKHELERPAIILFECILCKEKFEVRVYPNIFIYPKYCDVHRNEFKRQLWFNQHPEFEHAIIIEAVGIEVVECINPHEVESTMEPDTFIDYEDDFALLDGDIKNE